jgi:hypothetical protein
MINHISVPSQDELVPVFVPRKHYLSILNFIATITTDEPTCTPAALLEEELTNGWTPEQIGTLRGLLPIGSVATSLLELACTTPGRWVFFEDARERTQRGYHEGRADFAGLTRLIKRTWGKDRRWPVNWKQEGSRVAYSVSQAVADAWNAAVHGTQQGEFPKEEKE